MKPTIVPHIKQPMALILQGGGALGAFESGVVTELVERGWTPTAVSGVSIGAINAAAIAGAHGSDIAASLRNLWAAITLPEVPWLPPSQQANLSLLGNPNFWRSRTDYLNLLNWTSFCETTPMRTTLEAHCDFDRIRNAAHMRVAVTATDLETGGSTTFSNYLAKAAQPNGQSHKALRASLTPEHILASGSLPPGFPATVIDGHSYWDGGLFSNTPVDALLNMLEPDEIAGMPIFVVDLFTTAGQALPANLVEVQTRALALQYQNRFWAEYGGSAGLGGFVDMLDTLNGLVGADGGALKDNPAYLWLLRLRALKNLHVIKGAPAASGADHDFSPYGIDKLFNAGRAAVLDHFARAPRQTAQLAAA
jgi:NTE family protein